VSVQTLHPTKFDHGEVLAQTPLPGIPIHENMSATDLQAVLAVEGSKLLSKVVQNGLFVPPVTPTVFNEDDIKTITDGKGLARAPKISKMDTRVEWDKMTANEILLRRHVFGSLWDETLFNDLDHTKVGTRVIFESLGKAELAETTVEQLRDSSPGHIAVLLGDSSEQVVIKAADGSFIEVLDCTISGENRGTGKSLRKLKQLLQSKDRQIK
jgi:methionyl-tRNA formyltransferase